MELDPSAQRADYVHDADDGTGAWRWDAPGLMSDLRVARGRRLFAALCDETARWQRAHARLSALLGDGADEPPTDDDAPGRSATRPRLVDYCHSGDRWDVDALRGDLSIERQRVAALCQGLAALGEDGGVGCGDATAGVAGGGDEGAHALFYLCGAVDGVTEERVVPERVVPQPPLAAPNAAAPNAAAPNAEACNARAVRRVVVEVKHRVGAIKRPPPFYDEVQLATYCLMLGLSEGDMVQCARHDRTAGGETIYVTRTSLHGGPLDHAASWHTHVRPRLYEFAAFVHRVRECHALRYRYVLGDAAQRRAVLTEGLPYLRGAL